MVEQFRDIETQSRVQTGLDIRLVQSVNEIGHYDLGQLEKIVNTRTISDEPKAFFERLLKTRQVVYDIGGHVYWVYDHPFQVQRVDQKILYLIDGEDVGENQSSWSFIDPSDFHNIAKDAFSGEWGPTTLDTISILLSSGLTVTLANTRSLKIGPDSLIN